jgi:hypothetical protein
MPPQEPDIIRTRVKRDIVAEVALPTRHSCGRALVIADGVPSVPGKRSVMAHFASLGYYVALPRYRGAWESAGTFLRRSPAADIRDTIEQLSGSISNAATGAVLEPGIERFDLLGISFGGPAALLNSGDERVHSVLGVAPVVNWRQPGPEEPLDWLYDFLKAGFGQAYRFRAADWRALSEGSFFNPVDELEQIAAEKVFLVHARDDMSVPAETVEQFAAWSGAKFRCYKRGGHLSSRVLLYPPLWRQISRFLERT